MSERSHSPEKPVANPTGCELSPARSRMVDSQVFRLQLEFVIEFIDGQGRPPYPQPLQTCEKCSKWTFQSAFGLRLGSDNRSGSPRVTGGCEPDGDILSVVQFIAGEIGDSRRDDANAAKHLLLFPS
jgi:hypothetical protein